MSMHWEGVMAALVTGVSWGVVSPVGRILALRGVDMTTTVVLRAFFVAIFMLLWILLTDRSALRLTPVEGISLAIYSIVAIPMTGACFMYSLEYLTVPQALIIHYTFPLVTLLGDLWITKERPTPLQYVAAALVIAGVWTGVFSKGEPGESFSLPGILWGAMAVVGLSGQFIAGRVMISREKMPAAKLLFYSHLLGWLIMATIKHLSAGWGDIPALGAHDLGMILIITFFGSILAYGAYCVSLKYISAATSSHICTIEIPTGIILAALMSNEMPTAREVTGSLMIVAAILLASMPKGSLRGQREDDGQSM